MRQSDLRHCLAERERKGRIIPLRWRTHASRSAAVPEKLYGRSREIELLSSSDRIVNDGAWSFVLVSVYSASANLGRHELHRRCSTARALRIMQFDQYKRAHPPFDLRSLLKRLSDHCLHELS